jgi:hypothetical protein
MDTNIRVAQFLAQQIALSPKKQNEIASEVGYDKPNVITMIKQGKTKLPLAKVGPMARALGIDPVHLLRLVLQEYYPENWQVLEGLIGERLVSADELALVKLVRAAAAGMPIDVSDAKVAGSLRACVAALAVAIGADRESARRAVDDVRARTHRPAQQRLD